MKQLRSSFDTVCDDCGRTIPAGTLHRGEQEGLHCYRQCDTCETAESERRNEYEDVEA
jgi:hypothetical protein